MEYHSYSYEFVQEIWRPDNNVNDVIDECYDNSIQLLEDKVYSILSYSGLVDQLYFISVYG